MDDKQKAEVDELRQLFDSAAAKSLAMYSSVDAEPEMARFVEFIKCHERLRPDVLEIVAESFSTDFYMKWPPVELWRYCMHALRWPEMRAFILSKKKEEMDKRSAPCSGVWDYILEVFDDNWRAAQEFEAFKTRQP